VLIDTPETIRVTEKAIGSGVVKLGQQKDLTGMKAARRNIFELGFDSLLFHQLLRRQLMN